MQENINQQEKELLEQYRAFNQHGKCKILDYINMLTETGKYKKGIINLKWAVLKKEAREQNGR